MRYIKSLTVLWTSVALASISIRRAGWLDRVVEYHKKRFFEDFKKLPVVNINARIETAPSGYIDSKDWDYDSVIRLLTLIRDSEGAKTVKDALRRSMQSRRYMSVAQSFKHYPSLSKVRDNPNYFFYPIDSEEFYADDEALSETKTPLKDDDIIIVNNPVEAKLPSARISVKLLKSIMQNRAQAVRFMSTTRKTISWPVMSKKPTTEGIASAGSGNPGAGNSSSSQSSGAHETTAQESVANVSTEAPATTADGS